MAAINSECKLNLFVSNRGEVQLTFPAKTPPSVLNVLNFQADRYFYHWASPCMAQYVHINASVSVFVCVRGVAACPGDKEQAPVLLGQSQIQIREDNIHWKKCCRLDRAPGTRPHCTTRDVFFFSNSLCVFVWTRGATNYIHLYLCVWEQSFAHGCVSAHFCRRL